MERFFVRSCCTRQYMLPVGTVSWGKIDSFFILLVFDSFMSSNMPRAVVVAFIFKNNIMQRCVSPSPHILGKTNNTTYRSISNVYILINIPPLTWGDIDRLKNYVVKKLFNNNIFISNLKHSFLKCWYLVKIF